MVRLSFAGSSFTAHANLHANVMAQLDGVAEQQSVSARYATAPERFGTVHARAGQRVAVVLVDEYDKPVLDALETPEVARANPRLPARDLFPPFEQPHRHHPGSAFLVDLRLHGG